MNIGNVWRKGLLLGILLLLVMIGSAQAENFTVRVEKDIIGFDENQITVETDQTGLLSLSVSVRRPAHTMRQTALPEKVEQVIMPS